MDLTDMLKVANCKCLNSYCFVSDVRSEVNSGVWFPLATFALSSRDGTHIHAGAKSGPLTHLTAPDCKP